MKKIVMMEDDDDKDSDDGDDYDKEDDDIPEDHVLDGDGEGWHLPGYVGLPAAPGLGDVLEDHPGLVLLDARVAVLCLVVEEQLGVHLGWD